MDKDYEDIIDGLIQKSTNKEVKWTHANQVSFMEPTENEDDFAVSTRDFTVNIFRMYNSRALRVNIHNARGNLVSFIQADSDEEDFPKLEMLLELARKIAQGEEELLKIIKINLEKPGILGKEEDIPF